MITHLAVFRWKNDVDPAQIAGLREALAELPDLIPALVTYRFGEDLGLREGNGDFGVMAVVADEADVSGYLDHPAHLRVVEKFTRVMAAQRITVQFSVKD
ncbi:MULTISPECIES: Dabb family protein [unclassified Streptosporangium]|uniref:Dabb family protein n=1 Tax=unclassified Streptosporangium TaxID=2632669 RepID=UPI002E2851B5|nr:MULTISPECIES: Dabb family protein [unclassified Streptosporangium]